METVEFLGDIDDEKLYARKLELAYNEAYQQVLKILLDFPQIPGRVELDEAERCIGWIEGVDSKTRVQLEQMRFVMRLQLRQLADRRRRLADVAVGLTDRVLDEEST